MMDLLSKYAKLVTYFIIISGAVLGFTTYFATSKDLKGLEANTLSTFKSLQEQIQRTDEQRKLDFLTQRYYQLKDLRRRYPADPDLKEEYLEVKEELRLLKLLKFNLIKEDKP
uniref:Uncharacterized protein n=2 Tax=viral metagenome TaxID=1070528 RepID=A0A6M3LMT4_9ZZZZ